MRKLLMTFLITLCIHPPSMQAKSISEVGTYPIICYLAAHYDEHFSYFKSLDYYRTILEHVTYEQGLEYLNFIRREYPDILKFCDRFHENDTIGSPVMFDYGDIGTFSPTTLRYMKVAGDLRQEFGDGIAQMHIVEVGGGYGGQCKILADLCGFASYTIIDLSEANQLAKRCLDKLGVENVRFINREDLDQVFDYDLMISNYSFSELDRIEQTAYLNKVIKPTPNGYMTMNFMNETEFNSYTIEELINIMSTNERKGRVEAEEPSTNPDAKLLVWKDAQECKKSVLKEKKSLMPSTLPQKQNAITYNLSGGRFGDNLIAYFHAKWVARELGLPFLYKPFPYADQLLLSEMDQPLNGPFHFNNVFTPTQKYQISDIPNSILMTISYFADFKPEYQSPWYDNRLKFPVDWEDPDFHRELMACLTLKQPIKTATLPRKYLTVAVHVRRGGSFEPFADGQKSMPLKFPPDSYYIAEIQRMAHIYPDKRLYVYIFSDDQHPKEIAIRYAAAIQNPNLVFNWENYPSDDDSYQMFYDFFSMAKFDCLIRSGSSFSLMAGFLGNHKIIITPMHYILQGDDPVVDKVEIQFKAQTKR